MRYLQVYFATVDLVSEALGKFQMLATDATTVSQRSLYRAKALEAERDLELLKNQRSDLPGFFAPLISGMMAPFLRGAHEKESIHRRANGCRAA